jgi:hypothetical protein
MKSRITIDVDNDNQPIIRIDYGYSDDVRDKLVKIFLESFGTASAWSRITFGPSTIDGESATIRPVSPDEMGTNADEMSNLYEDFCCEIFKPDRCADKKDDIRMNNTYINKEN